jgi:hypothetical protein
MAPKSTSTQTAIQTTASSLGSSGLISPSQASTSGLPLGAKVGLGVGLGIGIPLLLLLGAVAGMKLVQTRRAREVGAPPTNNGPMYRDSVGPKPEYQSQLSVEPTIHRAEMYGGE